jgi:hypothetical protein
LFRNPHGPCCEDGLFAGISSALALGELEQVIDIAKAAGNGNIGLIGEKAYSE